jgi:hypothetical protein
MQSQKRLLLLLEGVVILVLVIVVIAIIRAKLGRQPLSSPDNRRSAFG